MGYNLKATGEASGDFEALPMNRYNLKVEAAEFTKASTGNDMIATTFVVTEGEFKNRKLWNNFTLTPAAMVFLFQFLKAAGSDLIDKEDISGSEIANAMVGMEVSAYTEPSKTNAGNPRNVLTQWKPATNTDSGDSLLS